MITVPPPPIVLSEAASSTMPRQELVTLVPGTVTCDGVAVAPVRMERPTRTVATRFGPAQGNRPNDVSLSFAIDAAGRPRTIRRSGAGVAPGMFVDTSDAPPALAASRFPAGAPRQACAISYAIGAVPLDEAPLDALYEAAALAGPQNVIGSARLRPPGADCLHDAEPRRINFPAFERIPQRPGTRAWIYLAYDVDRSGRVRHPRRLASSGNPALDRAGLRALAANRYAPDQSRHGCLYRFVRNGETIVPPVPLPAGVPDDNGELPACSIDRKTLRGLEDGSAYPAAFARRRIEGMAALSFDTAPWGALGNIRVIASEPDEAFGQAASGIFAGARVPESEVGHRGCVRHVRFRLPDRSAR